MTGGLKLDSPEMEQFFSQFIYSKEAFLIDEILVMDSDSKLIEARMRTDKVLPIGREQRGDPKKHPKHVSGPELILLTGNMGCLHGYFFYHCRWEEGWVGFGNRIHRADFRRLVTIGPELLLRSKETRTRVGSNRVMLRFEFEFFQEGKAVYFGDQSAIFVKDKVLLESA